jgi:hypothetical protein
MIQHRVRTDSVYPASQKLPMAVSLGMDFEKLTWDSRPRLSHLVAVTTQLFFGDLLVAFFESSLAENQLGLFGIGC